MEDLIKYPKRAKQLIDFTGVKNGKIHPSDIDAVLEYDNQHLLLFEVKLKGVQVPLGQRLMLERIVDSWSIFKFGTVVYCEHTVSPPQTVYLKDCTVIGIYNKGKSKAFRCDLREFLFKYGVRYNIDKILS